MRLERRIKRQIVAVATLGTVLAMILMSGRSFAGQETTPTDSVKSTITDLVRVLVNQDMNHPGRSADRLNEIERALRSHVSFDEMARRSLGHPWRELSDIEQQVFANLFIQSLSRSVAGWRFEDPIYGRLGDPSSQLVTYLSERSEGRFSEVATRIRGMKVDTQLDFRLVNQSGDWRIYDVVADYVSVSDNYRSQFANILRMFSFDELSTTIKKTPLLQLLERTLSRR